MAHRRTQLRPSSLYPWDPYRAMTGGLVQKEGSWLNGPRRSCPLPPLPKKVQVATTCEKEHPTISSHLCSPFLLDGTGAFLLLCDPHTHSPGALSSDRDALENGGVGSRSGESGSSTGKLSLGVPLQGEDSLQCVAGWCWCPLYQL